MDFTTQYAFPGAHQPFHPAFMPLTPSHSQSAASDQFNSASPPDLFSDSLPSADHFAAAFEYVQDFSAAGSSAPFPGPPTPPGFGGDGGGGGGGGQQNQHYQQHQQHQQQQQQLPARTPSTNGSVNGSNNNNNNMFADNNNNNLFADNNADDLAQGRGGAGSDDDDNMTPAQSRRKAQNRAAQRAFRERKEKHVKDLESKLASLEAAQKEAATENERLRRDLHKMSTENEILRATSAIAASASASASSPEPLLAAAAAITSTGPMTYQPTDFYSDILQGHKNKAPSHRIVTADDGQRLAAGAAWDFIIAHDLYTRGLVDVSKVSDLMKHCAKCDGQGPVFSERDIVCAIEQSIASGSDDLL